MRTGRYAPLAALATLASLSLAEDLLFPHMHGLKYAEYDQAVKLGLTAHICKDEDEWYGMTTADFAKYKAIIVPDCLCNTSLSTIKFLDDTKGVWSPAVTGNMVLIGTDPSFHAKYYHLPGALAMMQDSISLVTAGKNGTGMYFSLSCYYQSNAAPMSISALSEIGNFQVRGNLSHPCLNNAHIVAKSNVMTTLSDENASNWNCSVHEVFSEYPRDGSGGFEALAIALNATGLGQRSFADKTSGIPYIIARGATPLGCGNSITEPTYNEECDNGSTNGAPGDLCSSSCKCLYGMITPGVCRSNVTSSSSPSSQSSTHFTNSSTAALSTSLLANSSSSAPLSTPTLPPNSSTIGSIPSNFSSFRSSSRFGTAPVTLTVTPPGPPPKPSGTNATSQLGSGPSSLLSSTLTHNNVSVSPPPSQVTVTAIPSISPKSSALYSNGSVPPPHPPVTVTASPSNLPGSLPGTVTVFPPSLTEPPVETVTANPPGQPSSTETSKQVIPSGNSTLTPSSQPGLFPPPPETVTVGSSGPLGNPPETITVDPSGQLGISHGSNSSIPQVTVTASHPSQITSPSVTGTEFSSGIVTGLPVGTSVSVAKSLTNRPTQVTDTTQSFTPPAISSDQLRSSSGSLTISHSSPAGETTGVASDVPPETVTVLPPDVSSSLRTSEHSTLGETRTLGYSSHGSGYPNTQTPLLTTNSPSSSRSELPGSSGDYYTLSGAPFWTTHRSQFGSVTTKPTADVSGSPSDIATADPIGKSSASLSQTAGTELLGSLSRPIVSSNPPAKATVGPIASSPLGGPASYSSVPMATVSSNHTTGYKSFSSNSVSRTSTGVSGEVTSDPARSPSTPDSSGSTISSRSLGTQGASSPGVESGTFSSAAATETLDSTRHPSYSTKSPSSNASAGIDPSGTRRVSSQPSHRTSQQQQSMSPTGPDCLISSANTLSAQPAFPTTPTEPSPRGSSAGVPTLSSAITNTSLAAPSSGQCGKWIGIEIIYMVEITETCAEGSAVTETVTECVATLTRSICQSSASSFPCYPCILGTEESPNDTATVTMTSCSTSTESTVTITAQHCRTCTTTTYVGTVPGYTPGGPCHGCSPYSASTSLDSLPLARPTAATSPSLQVSGYPGYSGIPTRPNSPGLQRTSQESESTIDPGGVGLPATSSSSGGITKLPDDATPTQPPPVASAVPGYPDRPGSPYLPNQPSPPGNPGVPHLLGSTTLPPMASPDSTEPGPTNTPYRPTAVPAPPIVTAGGVRAMPRNVGLGLTGCLLGAAILRM